MLPTRVALSRSATLGWIGLGAMGNPMALNLFTKVNKLSRDVKCRTPPSFVVCDPSDANVASFIESVKQAEGPKVAARIKRVNTPAEMATDAARVFTMLPSTPQVDAVYLGENGLMSGLAGVNPDQTLSWGVDENPWLCADKGEDGPTSPTDAHTLLVDHTTLDPTAAKRVADTVHKMSEDKVHMIDAPVSGGINGAHAGTLTIMFGSADPVASALATPLMQLMAREGGVVPCGKSGAGVGVKVCNNLVLAINQIGLAEGLALGASLEIDPLLLHRIFNGSTAQSWSSKVNSPLKEVENSPGSRDFNGGFQAKLMLKDVRLALEAAAATSLPVPMTWAAGSIYDAVCQDGSGDLATKDFAVVFEWLKRKQQEGVEIGWKAGGPGDK